MQRPRGVRVILVKGTECSVPFRCKSLIATGCQSEKTNPSILAVPFAPVGALLILVLAALTACDPKPWYGLPEQRQSFEKFRATQVVAMDGVDTDHRIVRDIAPNRGTSWRWAMQRPAVKFRVHFDENLKYTIDFTLPEVTFKDTGPVTISFLVNGHLLEQVHYSEQGAKHFEKPVPRGWLKVDEDNEIGAEIDRLWTGADGNKFGFIITRMGLTE
jgi:hypothetical protein